MILKKYLLLTIFIFFQLLLSADSVAMEHIANTITTDLYETMGNKTIPVPRVQIIRCQTPGQCSGARYRKRTNSIELEIQLYEVCRSFGKDSLNALAFVLGHELGHYYSANLPNTNIGFKTNYNETNDRTDKEHQADIHGIFNAYLSGYDTRSIIPRLLNAIYDSYELRGKPLYGYPSLEKREYTPKQVLNKVNELIQVFDLANYLVALEEYDGATAAYEHILQYYQGKEIYNNLGVNYALEAINFTKTNYDIYVFPLELELETRLKKDKSDTGIDAINQEDVKRRNELLEKAMQQFKIVSTMDRTYLLDDLNIVCIHLLKQEHEQALSYFNAAALERKAQFLKSPALEQAKIQLVKALMLAHFWDKQQEAIKIWSSLSNNPNAGIAFQANYNLAIITAQEPPECETNYECYEPVNTNVVIDQFNMSRQSSSGFRLGHSGYQLTIDRRPNSIIYILDTPQNNQFLLQRIVNGTFKNRQRIKVPDLQFNSVNTLLANGNFFTVCEQKQTAFLGTVNNRLLEWGRFQRFD